MYFTSKNLKTVIETVSHDMESGIALSEPLLDSVHFSAYY